MIIMRWGTARHRGPPPIYVCVCMCVCVCMYPKDQSRQKVGYIQKVTGK